MQPRYNLAHMFLAAVIVFGLTLLVTVVDVQAQIVFASDRDGHRQVYVMDADGGNLQELTNDPHADITPAWLNSRFFSISLAGKRFTVWGRLKQVAR